MPGVFKEEKPEIAGAICAPPAPSVNGDSDELVMPQPRQPSSLQGLLRFAMEATKSEDAPAESQFTPMDEERKQFLENALKSMTIDVVELLQKQIKTLENVDALPAEADASEYLAAIETILEHVDQIDIANDFHKIGGFCVLKPCLKSVHSPIRIGACEILAEVSQNNPYCQKVVVDQNYIPLLLELLEKEQDNQVAIKILYAISCIVRDNMDGFHQIIHYGGLNTLLKTLERNEDKLRTKITFLLSTMCRMQPDLKSRLVFLNYVPVLINLISQERMPSHEHVLSLLVSLVEDNHDAVNECRNERYSLRDVLEKYLHQVEGKPESLEEKQYCKRLLQATFGHRNGL